MLDTFLGFLYTGLKLLHSFCISISLFVASRDSAGLSLVDCEFLLFSGVNFETSGLVFYPDSPANWGPSILNGRPGRASTGNWSSYDGEKNIASSGNRTQAARVAGEHSTTEPTMPCWHKSVRSR